MADTLLDSDFSAIGTTAKTVFRNDGSTKATIIGIHLANINNNPVKVTVKKNNTHIVKNTQIMDAGAFNPIGGGKLNLGNNDVITVVSDTDSSIDVCVSYLEQT
jgi:hypothetical protein